MCGIVGFANLKENISHSKDDLLNMNSALSLRGPDEDGYYINDNICIGHKRLIVVDPQGGKQPMIYKDGNQEFVITYNGQIYNFISLRKDLQSLGFTFSSNSDTEVLLKAYIAYGSDVVNKLSGIFLLLFGIIIRRSYS